LVSISKLPVLPLFRFQPYPELTLNNLRVKKNVDGDVENYYLDRDNIAFVTDGDGKQTFHYLYGMGADQVLAQDSETGMVWSLADRLGSIDVLTNEQGVIVDQRTYDSFGNTLSQLDPTVKFRFGYTGRESDPETGLYYYRARYFDANVGRFISTDPIGFEAGDSNLYRYVNNSSALATDPTGELANIVVGAVIGGVIGFGISTARQTANNPGWGYATADGFVLLEGESLATQTSSIVAVGSRYGTRTVEFDLADRVAVYLVDLNDPKKTYLDGGLAGAPVFTLSETGTESITGITTYKDGHLVINTSSILDVSRVSLVVQLLISCKILQDKH
jgi:RHS repeat-associated protein